MPLFYLICGIPASGKSTIAKQIAAENHFIVISSDEIRQELYPGKKYNPKQNEKTFRIFKSRITEAFKAENNIIIDAINRRPSERKLLAERAKKKGYHTVCVYCKKDSKYAVKANRMRDEAKRVPDEVIINNHNLFNPPTESESWDEIRVNDGNKYSIETEKQK